jgi:hypothetical protein
MWSEIVCLGLRVRVKYEIYVIGQLTITRKKVFYCIYYFYYIKTFVHT